MNDRGLIEAMAIMGEDEAASVSWKTCPCHCCKPEPEHIRDYSKRLIEVVG